MTEKEIKFLNFLYKKLGGKHLDTLEVAKFIEEKIKLSKQKSYELAYLYDHNFDQSEGEDGMGNFANVTEPERETYEEYKERVPWQIKAVMTALGEDNPEDFELIDDEEVEHHGNTYRIYMSEQDIRDSAESNDLSELLCHQNDPDENYIYITDTDRRIVASEEADNRVDNMDDDDIIFEMDLEDTLEELESYNENKEKVKELEDELAGEEDEEEINRIQSEIDEIESEINNIGVTQTREEIIENAKEELRSTYYDQIYDELDDPVRYFIHDNGLYADASQLIENGPVMYDCDKYIEDYLDGADTEELTSLAGYSYYEEVRTEDHGYVYVLWY